MVAGGALKPADNMNVIKNIQQVNLSTMLFFHISLTAKNKSINTPIPTPQNILCINLSLIISSINLAIMTIETNAGKTIPIIAAMAPGIFLNLYPTNIDKFAAISPGML